MLADGGDKGNSHAPPLQKTHTHVAKGEELRGMSLKEEEARGQKIRPYTQYVGVHRTERNSGSTSHIVACSRGEYAQDQLVNVVHQ